MTRIGPAAGEGMARRKKAEGVPMNASEAPPAQEKGKLVRLELSPEIHDLLSVVAGFHRMSMAQFARFAVEQAVRGEIKRHGIPTEKPPRLGT